MCLIGLLIALTIVGLITARQLSGPTASPEVTATQTTLQGVPAVPQRADQIDDFKKQMNEFVDQHNAQQRKRLQQLDATQ